MSKIVHNFLLNHVSDIKLSRLAVTENKQDYLQKKTMKTNWKSHAEKNKNQLPPLAAALHSLDLDNGTIWHIFYFFFKF